MYLVRRTKRLIALVLAIAMVFSMGLLPAGAVDVSTDEYVSIDFSSGAAKSFRHGAEKSAPKVLGTEPKIEMDEALKTNVAVFDGTGSYKMYKTMQDFWDVNAYPDGDWSYSFETAVWVSSEVKDTEKVYIVGNASNGSGTGIWVNKGKIAVYAHDGTDYKEVATTDCQYDQWMHIVGTYDDNTHILNLYVNGEHCGSTAMAGRVNFFVGYSGTSNKLVCGSNHNIAGGDGFFGGGALKGKIAYVHVYEKTVSAAEATELYAASGVAATLATPTPVPTPDLAASKIADFDFSEGVWNEKGGAEHTGETSLTYRDAEELGMKVGVLQPSSQLKFKTTPSSSALTEFAVEMYIKVAPVEYGEEHQLMAIRNDWTGLFINGGKLLFRANDVTVNADSTLPQGEWLHIVGVRSATKIQLYVNGQLVDEADAKNGNPPGGSTTSLYVGSSLAPSLDMDLANFRMYKAGITAEQVAALYEACPKAQEPTPTPVPTPTLEESLLFNADYTTGSAADKTGNFSFGGDENSLNYVTEKGIKGIRTDASDPSLIYSGTDIPLGRDCTFEVYFWSDASGRSFDLLKYGNEALEFSKNSGFGFYGTGTVVQGSSDNSLYLGKWTHVVATVKDQVATIYLNGTKLFSGEWANMDLVSGTEVKTGTKRYIMAFARIYNNAATAEEVAALYAACPEEQEPTPTPVPTPTPTLEESLVFNADYTTGAHDDKKGNFAFDRSPDGFPVAPHLGIQSITTNRGVGSLKYKGNEISLGDTATYEAYFLSDDAVGRHELVSFGNVSLVFDPENGFDFAGVAQGAGHPGTAQYLGKWTHVVAVVENGTATIYLNGEKLISGATGVTPSGNRVDAGYDRDSALEYYMAFARIYDNAASAEEVKSLYDACPKAEVPVIPDHLELIADETKLVLNDDYLQGVKAEQTPAEILAKFESNEYVVIVKADGSALADGEFVGTGCFVRLMDGDKVVDEVQVIVKGDTDGDGKITSTDYLQIRKQFRRELSLEGVAFIAADINGDNEISTVDYLRIRYHFAGSFNLYENL